MASVRWSLEAQRDLVEILGFLRPRAPNTVRQLVIALDSSVERLGSFPRSGRMVPEFSDVMIRELILDEYRLVYLLVRGDVLIVTLAHGRRNLFRILRDRL